jgi:hypothetical protein
MSSVCPNTVRGPRRWLIAALISAGCLAAAPGWSSPAAAGGRLPEMGAAAAGAPLSAFVDPAWRWLRQLWLGLPWPTSGGGGTALSSRPGAAPGGRHRHTRAASRVSSMDDGGNHECRGDCDEDDPGHGGDPDG